MSIDTKELRHEYINDTRVGRGWFEAKTLFADKHFIALLDALDASAATIQEQAGEIAQLDELATQAKAFCESLAKSLTGANTKVSEMLDANDRLADALLRVNTDNARLTAENAALRQRCSAAEGLLRDICTHCGWRTGPTECANPDCHIAPLRGPQQEGAGE